jgi:K+-transporting ATPase ATPase C chain
MPALRLLVALSILCGGFYPVLVTLIGRGVFPEKSEGSFIIRGEHVIGSQWIGQKFVSPKYFWGRPSSVDNNPLPSGGSNLGPTSAALLKAVRERDAALRSAHGTPAGVQLPKDLLFASASGLDPEISPEAAYFQVDRIVKAREFNETQKQRLLDLIASEIVRPDLGFLGEPRINVVQLNMKLDELDVMVARQ